MSADWFCKIGEKKVGPINSQQLKSAVSKGQIKPEHLVRRGSEGPWVPAGRIKGLFPESAASAGAAQAKKQPPKAAPLDKAANGKAAKAGALPTAAEAAAPPAGEVPAEFALGGHGKHVQMNVDSLNIETAPVQIAGKKRPKGVAGLKKSEQKKLNIILLSVIGGGLVISIIALIVGIASGKFASPEKKNAEIAQAKEADDAAQAKAADEKRAKEKADAAKEADIWKAITEKVAVGPINVLLYAKPQFDVTPSTIQYDKPEVIVVSVSLQPAKEGETKTVDFAGWKIGDKNISLKDDQNNSCAFLGQVLFGDTKVIGAKSWVKAQLVFAVPTNKKYKSLHLELPGTAFGEDGMARFGIKPGDIETTSGLQAARAAGTTGGESKGKSDKKPAAKSKKKSDDDLDLPF